MTTSEVITIIALFSGPIVAVQLTRYLDDRKEIRERKLSIFKKLMATRATAYNTRWEHVEALNCIDLEFDPKIKKEKAVIEAWNEYLHHLGTNISTADQWLIKSSDLLAELLYRMAIVLNYDFDKTHMKTSVYSPSVHGRHENEEDEIRKGTIEFLKGKITVPISVQTPPPPPPQQIQS